MSARKTDSALLAGSVVMILCCIAGPAALGAVAGSVVGGWLGIACAIVLATVVAVAMRRRVRGGRSAC